jgi:hypothetical protein
MRPGGFEPPTRGLEVRRFADVVARGYEIQRPQRELIGLSTPRPQRLSVSGLRDLRGVGLGLVLHGELVA